MFLPAKPGVTPTLASACSRLHCSANDEGLRLLAAGRLSEAFDCFTEAIRLQPTSPVYHCNRAAVCLKCVLGSIWRWGCAEVGTQHKKFSCLV